MRGNDFVDWSYASDGVNVEEFAVSDEVVAARQRADGPKGPFLRRMGLVRLEERTDGTLDRVETGAAAAFRAVATASTGARRS